MSVLCRVDDSPAFVAETGVQFSRSLPRQNDAGLRQVVQVFDRLAGEHVDHPLSH